MHVDMDAFFASVEQRDHPEYRGHPVIVGGLSPRGVVATASYEARAFGVHSAMPTYAAKRLCPQGIFLPTDMKRYAAVSEQIMGIFRETSPLVEQLSIDEAFLDLTGMENLGGSRFLAHQVQKRIEKQLNLSASVGLAPNKFLAKLASDLRKPKGFVVITAAEAAAVLAPLPVSKIFGVGEKAAAKLAQFGIETIGELASADLQLLAKVFGINAPVVKKLAVGLDTRPVQPEVLEKSLGREITFSADLTDRDSLKEVLLNLTGQVGWRLRRHQLIAHRVMLKLKYADFKTITRGLSVTGDLCWDEEIFAAANKLLAKADLREGVRLLGLYLERLAPAGSQPELGFAENEKLRQRNLAVDALKSRFGETIIKRGSPNLTSPKSPSPPKLRKLFPPGQK